MPTYEFIASIEFEDFWKRRGTTWVMRDTPGTRRWCRLLRRATLPGAGPGVVVVLTGKRRRDILDLGFFEPREEDGREVLAILLDDPHPKEIEAVYRQAREQLGPYLTRRRFGQAMEAYLVQVYLHELGHVIYCRRYGWGGREDPSEVFAEAYAWRALGRLVDRETLLLAWGLSWLAA